MRDDENIEYGIQNHFKSIVKKIVDRFLLNKVTTNCLDFLKYLELKQNEKFIDKHVKI